MGFREVKLNATTAIEPGTKLLLTWAQAEPRLGALEALDAKAVDEALDVVRKAKEDRQDARDAKADRATLNKLDADVVAARALLAAVRAPYLVRETVIFKAGEAFGVDGPMNRARADAMGIPKEEQDAGRPRRPARRRAGK